MEAEFEIVLPVKTEWALQRNSLQMVKPETPPSALAHSVSACLGGEEVNDFHAFGQP